MKMEVSWVRVKGRERERGKIANSQLVRVLSVDILDAGEGS